MWKFVHLSGSGRAVDKAKKLLHTVCFDSTQQGGIATTFEEAEAEVEAGDTVEDGENLSTRHTSALHFPFPDSYTHAATPLGGVHNPYA